MPTRPSPPSSCSDGAFTLTLHRADRQTGAPTCLRHVIDLVRSLLMPYPSNLLRRALRQPVRNSDASDRSALVVAESFPATRKGFPQTTENAIQSPYPLAASA